MRKWLLTFSQLHAITLQSRAGEGDKIGSLQQFKAAKKEKVRRREGDVSMMFTVF